jgi:hypothetical protein
MTDVNALLSGIENKIQKLILTQKEVKNKNIRLIEEKNELLKKIEEQNKLIKNLESEKKQNLLQNLESVEFAENKIEVSSKIEELVQEIDKCIEYLKS